MSLTIAPTVRIGLKPRPIKKPKISTEAASLSFTLPAENLSQSPLSPLTPSSDEGEGNPMVEQMKKDNLQKRIESLADDDDESDLSSDDSS